MDIAQKGILKWNRKDGSFIDVIDLAGRKSHNVPTTMGHGLIV